MSILLRFRHRSRLLGGGASRASGGRLAGLLRQFQMTSTLRAPLGRLRGLLTMQVGFKVQLAGKIRGSVSRLTGYAYTFPSGGPPPAATVSGTVTGTWYESHVVSGVDTLIITLANDTWVASGATFDAQRAAIRDGVVAATSPANGWNALRSTIPVAAVVRTSATVVTITIPALPTYSVSASETLTVTVPGSAVSGGSAIVASPTLTVTENVGSEPSPSGTIFYDGRAGGAQSWQAATSVADIEAHTGITFFNNSGGSSWAFASDYDGSGKHALRIDWPANASESFSQFLYYFPTAVHHLYASFVVHLGRTATGGGNGAVGSYTPSGGTSVKQKVAYFYRNADSATDRIYFHINDGTNREWGLLCDNLNIRDTWLADYGVGESIRYTFEFTPGSSFVGKVWRNGVLVKTSTAGFGSLNFNEFILGGTRWANPVADSMYYTDLVLWTDD